MTESYDYSQDKLPNFATMIMEELQQPSQIVLSMFPGVTGVAQDTTLQAFADLMTKSAPQRLMELVQRIRSLGKGHPDYARLKRELPCCTMSVHCTPGKTAKQENITNYTGLLCVDIDGADNPHLTNWGAIRNALGLLDCCYMSAISVGGNGVFLVLAIDTQQDFGQVFKAVELLFRQKLGLVIDHACSNPNRLRYYTYDPDAIIKMPTKRFKAFLSDLARLDSKSYTRKRERENRGISVANSGIVNEERVAAAVRIWEKRKIALEDYALWRKAGAALHHVPNGFEYFNRISCHAGNYDPATIAEKYSRFSTEKVQAKSFFYVCALYGITKEDISQELSTIAPNAAVVTRNTMRNALHEGQRPSSATAVGNDMFRCFDDDEEEPMGNAPCPTGTPPAPAVVNDRHSCFDDDEEELRGKSDTRLHPCIGYAPIKQPPIVDPFDVPGI